MTAEITMSQLHWNPSVMGFFFRRQAIKSYEEFISHYDTQDVIDAIGNNFCDLDEVEEMFYDDSMEEIAERLGLPLLVESDED